MGLPTNQAKGQGCNPVSSNCVIWQGPDIPCIDLCHGDSVTDVVFKLATELCNILDTLDIDTYDIDCFKPICPDPKDFHDLIQFLITKVCELQCCCDGTKPSDSDCPDACIITVAPCFEFQNQLGDTITTMTLTEYVTAIGNKLCTLIPDIATIDARIEVLEIDAGSTSARLEILETQVASVTVILPTTTCIYTAGTSIVNGVTAIANELCNLEAAVGTPVELLQAIQKQCANMDSLKTLSNRQNTYSGINGWITQAGYNTVADAINNMWLTVCDMRSAVENILATCCCTDCDDVNISFTAVLEGEPATQLNLFFVGTIPVGLSDCSAGGNQVTVKDSAGGSYIIFVPVVDNINDVVSINLNGTPINPALDLTITVAGCWNLAEAAGDCGGLRCERNLTYLIINEAPCPELTLTPGNDSIYWEFTNLIPNNVNYSVNLYLLGAPVATMAVANPGVPILVSGTFNGLANVTEYYVEVVVTVNAGVPKTCPQAFTTTLSCLPPTEVTAGTP